MTETPNLPAVTDARLPASYEAARKALTECSRIDECKSWADKAAALASYAMQAKDDSLRQTALRIQARAIRRCGELLKQIEPSKGGRPPKTSTGTDTSSRKAVANGAGLSKRQKDTAIRVASIPDVEFERQVESDAPPTVCRLAEQGTAHRPSIPDSGDTAFGRAIRALAAMREFCEQTDPVALAKLFGSEDVEGLREFVAVADAWLDRFVTSLTHERAA